MFLQKKNIQLGGDYMLQNIWKSSLKILENYKINYKNNLELFFINFLFTKYYEDMRNNIILRVI